jgi:RNA polymerase sigma-70 factor (ECF subfamily)
LVAKRNRRDDENNELDERARFSLDVPTVNELFSDYAAPLLVHLRLLLGNPHEADDVLQHTFRKVAFHPWKTRPTKTLIFKIGTNRCIDLLRRRLRNPLPLNEETYKMQPASSLDEPEMAAMVGEKRLELRQAMLRLLPIKLRPLVALDLAGWTDDQIAPVLGVVPGTVRNWRTKAYKILRDHPELLEVGNDE